VGQDTLLCLWDLTEVKQSLAFLSTFDVCLPFHGICKQSPLIEFSKSVSLLVSWQNFTLDTG
jgi:hypothetical protein